MSERAPSDHWCSLCALAASGEDRLEPADGTVVGNVGEYVTVLVRPALDEVLVAPTSHAATLGELRDRSLGEFLAALRRVSVLLRAGAGTVSLAPTNDFEGAEGHLCIRVVHESPGHAATRSEDARALARRLQG